MELSDTIASDPGATIRARPPAGLAGGADTSRLPVVNDELILGREIGSGGMGVVREATQVSLGRAVAVKVLRPDASDGAVWSLLQEAVITGALEHPNVVPVHALGRDSASRPVLVMKRIEGQPWRQRLLADPNREQVDEHLRVLIQVTNAVDFAHARGVVHRDIKPDNVMIGDYGEVYLVDWGLALRIEPKSADPQPIVGTPSYMAPEMIGEPGSADARTDVYLLGGLLHYILTRQPPHAGASIVEAMAAAERPALRSYDASLPRALTAIARRALSPGRADRYQSAADLRAAIQRYLSNRAAETVATEAERSLEELSTKLASGGVLDPTSLYRSFGACRFGFQQAKAIAPELDLAQSGFVRAIELMAGYELSRNAPEAAASLVAELDVVPAGLAAKVEASRSEKGREAAELDALRERERESDVISGSRARARVLLAMASAFIAIGALLGVVTEALELTFPFELGVRVAMVLGVVATLGIGRRWLAHNAAGKRLSLILLTAALALLALRILGAMASAEVELVVAIDLLLLGACGTVASITVDRRLLPASLFGAASAFVIAAYPRHAAALYISALLLCLTLVVAAWLLQGSDQR